LPALLSALRTRGDTTLDLGCGFGEFSRHVRAARKIAVDINPGVATFLPSDVEFPLGEAKRLDFIDASTIDVCFTSNFFEHLPSKQELDAVLVEVTRVLRRGGLLIALQPNIKYALGRHRVESA